MLIDSKYNTLFTPAMRTAALVGTAKSIKNGTDRYRQRNGLSSSIAARPNTVQGFGRYYLGDPLEGTQTYRLVDESSFIPFTAAGQQRSGWLTVSDSSKPVVLVLAWTDEPASLPAGTTLVGPSTSRSTTVASDTPENA